MQHLKCIRSNSNNYTVGEIYPILNSYVEHGGRIVYTLASNTSNIYDVPLEGGLWSFEVVHPQPKPRYHRKRKPVPKRTVTTAKVYYKDGSTYTVKHVGKVVCYGGKVSLFGRQDVTEGIEDSRLVKIDARLLRNIVVKSPSQVTQIERDFVQGDKWNVYRKTEQIFRAAQIDIEV